MTHFSSFARVRRRIPFFPLIPILPIAGLAANFMFAVMLYRRVRMLEQRLL